MSAPLIKDNLYVVLNNSNNWTAQGNLVAPINGVTRCRILSNNNCMIQASFLTDCYLLSGVSPSAQKMPGLVYAGDDKTWFKVKDSTIQLFTISLYSNITFDSVALNFQFI